MDSVVRWSRSNKLRLNIGKGKELAIDFKRIRQSFVPISINDKDLEYVKEGLDLEYVAGKQRACRPKHLKNNLLWSDHISDMIKKANKRLCLLILLKRARVPPNDIFNFYCTCVRIGFRVLRASFQP